MLDIERKESAQRCNISRKSCGMMPSKQLGCGNFFKISYSPIKINR